MEWKPIKTAPKDGTEILGFSDLNGITVINWVEYAGGYWNLSCPGDYAESTRFYDATHWMPLPQPPNDERMSSA